MGVGVGVLQGKVKFQSFSGSDLLTCMLPAFCLLTTWAISLEFCRNPSIFQCSFVYPYPSASALAGGNLDHGPRKTRTKTQAAADSVFIRERRISHGLSFREGKTQTMVRVWGVLGVGVDEGALHVGG